MTNQDSHDALTAVLAILADAAAVFGGAMLSVWIRFESGWIPRPYAISNDFWHDYTIASFCAVAIYICAFQLVKLYSRPQYGHFSGKIPRLVRASLIGGAGTLMASALLKNVIPYSNAVVLIAMGVVTFLLLLERYAMFKFEIVMASHAKPCHKALVIGANRDAADFISAVSREPRQRTQVVAVISTDGTPPCESIPPELLKGGMDQLESAVRDGGVDMCVLAAHDLSHDQTVDLVVFCEQHLIRFNIIPDLFRMMTNRMELQMIGQVPIVGIGRWPLDEVWNRIAKRILDIFVGVVGLVVSVPVILVSAIFIKRESPGPLFYSQDRCGRGGRVFRIYKLRTMKVDAESGDKPGWTRHDDPRRTKCGEFLRKWNLDELPQFWNVVKGEMSVVGPRPERPYYVERFTPGIAHYMWRHVSKPGLTGWAQVNGLRGDTSISDRVKYDLYYLENWSIAFDVKIILRTFLSHRNAC